MVYKKYIKRKGRIYGPYFYKSVKKEGKVTTEYIGKSEKKQSLKKYFLLGIIGLFIFASLILMVVLDVTFIGRAILDVEQNYQEGQSIEGILKFSLEEGEIIPASTNVIISLGNDSYNYILSDIVSDETISGDFSIKDKNISGSGDGYGLTSVEIYPSVSFIMGIYSKPAEEEQAEEITPDIPKEEKPKNTTEEPTEEVVENITEEQTEEPAEEQTEEPAEEQTEEPAEEQIEESKEPTEEVVEEPKESTEEQIEETAEDVIEEPKSEKEEKKEEKEKEVVEPKKIPVTGAITADFPDSIEDIYSVIAEPESMKLDKIIQGEVSADNPFTYKLEKGQTAEVTSSSQDVDLVIENYTAIITTDYEEETTKELTINLAELNILAKEGVLAVTLVYQDIEIVSATRKINIKPIKEINLTNETLPVEEISNQTLFTVSIPETTYLQNETIDISGIIILDGTKISDQITLEIEFNQTQIFTTDITSTNGSYEYSLLANFETKGDYSINVFYNNLTSKTSFFYLLDYILLEDFVCEKFTEDVLWSSGYGSKQEGSINYQTWNPKYDCSEIGAESCFIVGLNTKTRFIYLPLVESTRQGDGYVQISNPDESVCNNPKKGIYETYLVSDSFEKEEIKLDSYCNSNNVSTKCDIEILDSEMKESSCYGIKISSSQYVLVDVVEVAYSLCFEKGVKDV